jgi:polysaccharide pyruvyl transferase WcaK-like protein
VRIGVLGGAQDTANLGVNALGRAATRLIEQSLEGAQVSLQQHRRAATPLTQGRAAASRTFCLHASTRLRDRCGTAHVGLLGRLARRLPAQVQKRVRLRNETLDALCQCRWVGDISAGDAFSDLYGPGMFEHQAAVKELVLDLGLPLILLPQTFGPFERPAVRRRARAIFQRSSLVVTREANGLEELATLMKQDLDARFRHCPDVAFALEPVAVPADREPWMERTSSGRPLVGINVSGLMYFQGEQFRWQLDYPALIDRLIELAIDDWDAQVVLIPHVLPKLWSKNPHARPIDDLAASEDVAARLAPRFCSRLNVVRSRYDADEMKYLIGQCDFFVGARMHACIGAVSQGVPTALLAYSKKAPQVMALAGAQDVVVDPRSADLDECIDQIRERFDRRDALAHELGAAMVGTRRKLQEFFQTTLATVDWPAERTAQRAAS